MKLSNQPPMITTLEWTQKQRLKQQDPTQNTNTIDILAKQATKNTAA